MKTPAMLSLLVAACTEPPTVATSEISSESTVSTYVGSSCSTAVVIGLSKQIADEIGCANPTGLVKFAAGGNLQITSNAVLPYLSSGAKTDLEKVAQGRVVQVNSAFRTVVQQYLLYEWYLQGRCGITAAAHPGQSNHESGRAVDLANYSAALSAMGSHGWSHDVPGDPVHFDHLGSPDIRGRDVLAFQRLWNRNHPGDKIAEDGAYGAQTEARIRQAPAEGFAIGPTCLGTRDLDVVSIAGPDRVLPETEVHYTMTLKNTGTTTWPAATVLRLASGTSSPLHDASWISATQIAKLDATVKPNTTIAIDFDVTTPSATEDTPVSEQLVLDDGSKTFGEIQIALTVAPTLEGDESGDGSEGDDDGGGDGGCNASGRSGGLALVGLAIVLRRRRRDM